MDGNRRLKSVPLSLPVSATPRPPSCKVAGVWTCSVSTLQAYIIFFPPVSSTVVESSKLFIKFQLEAKYFLEIMCFSLAWVCFFYFFLPSKHRPKALSLVWSLESIVPRLARSKFLRVIEKGEEKKKHSRWCFSRNGTWMKQIALVRVSTPGVKDASNWISKNILFVEHREH